MSPKIERVGPSNVFGQNSVKRRESPDRDGSSDEKGKEERDSKKEEQEDSKRQAIDRSTVEQAKTALEGTTGFSQSGMKVEVLDGKDGLRIRLAKSTGETVKLMTAEDFMKLREKAEDGEIPRGKILDQRF